MKRRIIWRIVLGLVLLLAVVLCINKVIIPLFDTSGDLKVYVPNIQRYAGAEGDFTLTSDNLTFTLDPDTTHFTVTDHRTGKVWSSAAPGVAEDKNTVLNEKQRLQSIVTLDYKNNTGKQTTFSTFAHSTNNSLYTVERVDDEIRVTYTLGNIPRTYIYPEVITDEDMQALLDNSPNSKTKRTITDAYKKVDPNKYGKKDDPAALEAAYPILTEGKTVWVIRNKDMRENAMKKLETAFSDCGYTLDAYERDAALVADTGEIDGATDDPIFNVMVCYRLEGDDLVVEVPMSGIVYNPDYPPTTLDLLPAFGSAGTDETGYILVPEGSGALIYYNNGKTTQNSYYANMYGWDWASIRKEVVSETRINFPVFGMATQGSSFLCIIEEGVAWAGVNADVSGRPGYGSYNSANAEYTIIHGDSYDVSERTNNNVYMFEQQLPEGSISQRYRFVPSDDYMVMADAYRTYLHAKHPELNRELSPEAHTVVELVGAIDKVQQVLGVPTNVPIALTTYNQASELLGKLLDAKLPNLSIRYTGWMNGGMNQSILTGVRLMSELGSTGELRAFTKACADAGVPLYLDGLTQFARDSGILEGFVALRDAAQFTTREEAEIPEYSAIWYGPVEERDVYYLIKPDLALNAMDVLADASAEYGAAGVSFRDTGSMLSGDYNAKDLHTRQQVMNDQVSKLRELRADGQSIMIRQGNDYAVPLADIVTDMDFDGTPYRIIDEVIPFYPAALHGSVPYTGVSLNLADDREDLILRSAEMGASLQFTLMSGNVEEIQDSWFSEYYGADANIIFDDMINTVTAYNTEMSGTFNQKMVGHKRIGHVTVTEYENGTRVYVNYGYTDAEVDGLVIPARSYTAKEAME